MNRRARFTTAVLPPVPPALIPTILLAVLVAGLLSGCKAVPVGIEAHLTFDDLVGVVLYEGDTVELDGVVMTVLPTVAPEGKAVTGGQVQANTAANAGGSGLELVITNACVGFDFGGRVIGFMMNVADLGAWVNLAIHEELRTQVDLNGLAIPGVMITTTPIAREAFDMTIAGEIEPSVYPLAKESGAHNLVIGGNSVYIDDLISVVE